jgi:nucleoside-triphosphatase
MHSRTIKILLTGQPGCGKTTAVMKIISNLNPKRITGFYTQEIRRNNVRRGFRWKRLDGAEGTLAHIDIKGRFKVGKYGVDIEGFEKNVVPVLDIEQADDRLFVIDEIGKMECFSKKFTTVVRELFNSYKSVLATVAKKGPGLISEIKNYPNVQLFTLTISNRDKVVTEIQQILSFLRRT